MKSKKTCTNIKRVVQKPLLDIRASIIFDKHIYTTNTDFSNK